MQIYWRAVGMIRNLVIQCNAMHKETKILGLEVFEGTYINFGGIKLRE